MTAIDDDARAEALFCSNLTFPAQPSPDTVRAVIDASLHTFGVVGCAEILAQAYGDNPSHASARMRWCLTAVALAYRDEPVPV